MNKKKLATNLGVFSLLSLLIFSCAKNNNDSEVKVDKIEDVSTNANIWGTYGAEKIVQNRERSYYSSKDQEANISILTLKGESEIDQLVVTPNKDVKYFNVRVNDLSTTDGRVLSNKHFELFAAKYLKIDTIYDIATNETAGNFPDALIPVDLVVKNKTNQIKANTNQSFYLKVNIPASQKAGLYTGFLYIQLDNIEYKVPVSVDVKDYQVSSVTHSKSLFLNDWQFDSGENDSSQDKLDAYNEALLKYRLSPDKLIRQSDMNNNFDSDFIFRYTEKAYEYMQNDSCTNVSLPYETVITQVSPNVYYQNINPEKLKEFIRSYYVKSIATDYNMFKKTAFYCGIIDEPDDRQILDQTKLVVKTFRTAVKEVKDELAKTGYISNPLHEELINDIENLKNIVTCAYADDYAPYIDYWCPKANFYNTAEQRANYDEQKEKWWYTCVLPRAPYPTYHIEDGLTSARVLSWMQAEYDVVGNLFWATNVYARYNGTQYIPIEDYYEEGFRFTGVNGDGFLFYPGEPFGSDTPFGSTRLESIRDGLEEYELLYDLKEVMRNLGLDDNALFSFLNHNLYRGTKVSGTTKEMEEARKELIDLILANKNGSSFCLTECNYNTELGQVDFEFYANEESTIKFNGETLQPTSSHKDGHLFKATQKLVNDTNIANIEVSYGGKTNTISHNLGGKILNIKADELVNGFTKYNADVTATLEEKEGNKRVKIEVGAVDNKRQTIKYTPAFLSSINENAKLLSLAFENTSRKDIKFAIGAKFKNKNVEQYLTEGEVLVRGDKTTLDIDLSNINLKSLGSIEYLVFIFGEDVSEGMKGAVTAYLDNVVITY